jgi:transcription initiation factor TFIID subunit 13
MRVLDEILTEFIQGVSFEASRVAQLAGRQKVKYEDFQFAMRKSPVLLGKAAENKELREALEKQRKMFDEDEYTKEDVDGGTAAGNSGTGKGRKRKAPGGSANANEPANSTTNGIDDEELGDADDEEIDQLVAPSSRKA